MTEEQKQRALDLAHIIARQSERAGFHQGRGDLPEASEARHNASSARDRLRKLIQDS